MIVGIKGKLYKSSPLSAIIETNGGLFYELSIPITTAEKLPKLHEEVFLYTQAIYREDSQSLYGFATTRERDFFKLLVEKVSGIGPKIAVNILSRMSIDSLEAAISAGDLKLLSKCPGIGKKTAERLVLELRDLLSVGGVSTSATLIDVPAATSAFSDAVSALVALGYKVPEADKAVRKATSSLGDEASVEALIKLALKSA